MKLSHMETPLPHLLYIPCFPFHTRVLPPPTSAYLPAPRPFPPASYINHLLPNDCGTTVLPVVFCALRCLRCAARFRSIHRQAGMLKSTACAVLVLLDATPSLRGSTHMSASAGPSVGALTTELVLIHELEARLLVLRTLRGGGAGMAATDSPT